MNFTLSALKYKIIFLVLLNSVYSSKFIPMLYRTLLIVFIVSGFLTFGFAIATLFAVKFFYSFGFAFSCFIASFKQLANMERIAYD